MLKELLYHVITKYICHELYRVRMDLAEHLILLIAVCGLQLQLNEPRSVLVAAELNDMVVDVLLMSVTGCGTLAHLRTLSS